MKPFNIFAFLILLGMLCLGIALIFPSQGLTITNDFTLKFSFSFSDSVQEPIVYANINNIVEDVVVDVDTVIVDTLPEKIDTIRANAGQLKAKIQHIEYPNNDSTLLYTFFNKLDKANTKRVRVMHYGDSQIEGDRITGYLRNKLQKKFGGSGPGLMPAIPGHAESASIIHEASRNWRKHAVYYKKDTILPHREFGMMGSFARFTSYRDDSLGFNTEPTSATIHFNKSGIAYRSVRNFYECSVFYGHCNEAITVKGFVNDSLIWFQELDTCQITNRFAWEFTSPPDAFRMEFEGVKSPDFYGIALDAPAGVAVDNLPFRGSSGTEFTKMDYTQLNAMTNFLNPGLVIFEFGVNVVPHQVRNYNFYERALTRQLKYLKALMPQASFLVIGLSDMAQKKGNYYQSYPNIEKIRKAQRNAALNTNCAFWDMYQAMGGANSMPSWVFANPSLAQKDFIHFNRKGGHIIAQMFYNALMQEYDRYEKRKVN